MGFDKDFKPILRFLAMSDIHYKDEREKEHERMEKALTDAYSLCEKEEYSKLDALYVVGDFANRGTRAQMLGFKETLDNFCKSETEITLMMASHEFMCDGEQGAIDRFTEIFNMSPDNHKVINGYHFISVTTTDGCHFNDEKKAWISAELAKAAADDPKKPIFFFQHPHITDTVYGSLNWGEDEITAILMNYPQVIDFSGHSHAPINDPRSIHQRHFTCLGTGTLSYFELDEFDKVYGTIPPGDDNAAQMLIVEADAENRVRIYPYDVLTSNFFPYVWKIDTAWDPMSFTYTDERYKTTAAPWFEEGTKLDIKDVKEDAFTVEFGQAKVETDYVDDYNVYLKDENGVIVRNSTVWSEFYFYNMPETISVTFDNLEKNKKYYVEIYANSFWKTRSKTPLKSEEILLK